MSYFVTFVVVAAVAVSVVIWRYAMGWSLLIWNGLVMQLIILRLKERSRGDGRYEGMRVAGVFAIRVG